MCAHYPTTLTVTSVLGNHACCIAPNPPRLYCKHWQRNVNNYKKSWIVFCLATRDMVIATLDLAQRWQSHTSEKPSVRKAFVNERLEGVLVLKGGEGVGFWRCLRGRCECWLIYLPANFWKWIDESVFPSSVYQATKPCQEHVGITCVNKNRPIGRPLLIPGKRG